MSNYSTYSLGTNQVALLTIAYNDAENSSDPYGSYARVYELLFSMISTEGSGAYVSESDLTSIDLNDYWDDWKEEGLDEIDIADWEKENGLNYLNADRKTSMIASVSVSSSLSPCSL